MKKCETLLGSKIKKDTEKGEKESESSDDLLDFSEMDDSEKELAGEMDGVDALLFGRDQVEIVDLSEEQDDEPAEGVSESGVTRDASFEENEQLKEGSDKESVKKEQISGQKDNDINVVMQQTWKTIESGARKGFKFLKKKFGELSDHIDEQKRLKEKQKEIKEYTILHGGYADDMDIDFDDLEEDDFPVIEEKKIKPRPKSEHVERGSENKPRKESLEDFLKTQLEISDGIREEPISSTDSAVQEIEAIANRREQDLRDRSRSKDKYWKKQLFILYSTYTSFRYTKEKAFRLKLLKLMQRIIAVLHEQTDLISLKKDLDEIGGALAERAYALYSG